jgi:hypothetical protein
MAKDVAEVLAPESDATRVTHIFAGGLAVAEGATVRRVTRYAAAAADEVGAEDILGGCIDLR